MTEPEDKDIEVFIQLLNGDEPRYVAWVSEGLRSFASGPAAPTRGKAWRRLIRRLVKRIVYLEGRHKTAIEAVIAANARVDELVPPDTILASEVRQCHELMEEIDKIEGWRKAEQEEARQLQNRFDALQVSFKRLAAVREKLEEEYEELAARTKAIETHRDSLLAQQKAITDILNGRRS